MGRTRRKRKLRATHERCCNFSLESHQETICLKKRMHELGWENRSQLVLKNFASTGRGVSSVLNIKHNQSLIEVPYELLITCANALETEVLNNLIKRCKRTKVQDILATFLILEKHKGEKSKWKFYLDTLPDELPFLPWLSNETELSAFPSHLMKIAKKRKWDMDVSWERIEKSINSNWTCFCCGEPLNRVITFNAFTWGYAMVNTRAVYIQPDIVIELLGKDLSSYLSDEPCLALCPFLDMFNHSSEANIKAELTCMDESWKYTLTTLNAYKKHQQIYISYGSHDNEKLFCEYGFFLSHNHLDHIQYSLEEIASIDNISLSMKQRSFIQSRCLGDELYIYTKGLSFNLKALFFVIQKPDIEWSRIIYSEGYENHDYLLMYTSARDIVTLRKLHHIEELRNLESVAISKYALAIIGFLKHRIHFIEQILSFLNSRI
ncbi:SET domain-containing protein [Oryctes borbonicus]|uniref:SET domain-containing protein n=1 Tax=Oryctes borbonicus TaxID=1629725 RepID=A0A0T6AY81_9SCAR|nr:SET domain-containing protein [Oryctes borbonicus]